MASVFRFWVMLVTVFVFVQTAGVAHEAKYGDHSHSHDGVLCDIGTYSSQEIVIDPPVAVVHKVKTVLQINAPITTENLSWLWPPERAPPARGPPQSILT
ncbi:hypothetical protein [Hirschia baltica]|uniref:Uncharacterized protein n=1 Tax=Hirschia baltica (strain ATCC 49814 / DSM 5838 / IFAM 1418) TaxID=582402 RepID=C6XJL6_HIRBI|nr:hypothetical protein [Hirschia baltica]ACT59311.1 hypothetical protein Hbal_1623 [Hirschia baltica ATCC 49814]